VGIYSLFFEVLAPRYLSIGKGDPGDVIAYVTGALMTVGVVRYLYRN